MAQDHTQQRTILFADCKHEPIHAPGVTQPFCALLVSDLPLERVTHVSRNIAAILKWDGSEDAAENIAGLDNAALDADHETSNGEAGIITRNDNTADKSIHNDMATAMLGQPLDEILPADLIHDLSNVCGLPEVMTQRHRLGIYEIRGQSFDIAVHCTETRTLIELEPFILVPDSHTPLVMRVKAMLSNVADSDELLSLAVNELRNVTGFDRVMAYRFLDDGAGEVVAEACSPGAESYLGLRYPASDIPASSRDLFLKTGVRMIVDVTKTQVPILAFDKTEADLDLSLALLRGFSPVHGEYLSNMGVKASTTIAITVNAKLWGLFALHHQCPKLLSPDLRTVTELFSQLFSLQFQRVLEEKIFRERKRTASTLDKLFSLQDPSPSNWKTDIIQKAQALCQLLSAQGVSFVSEQTVLAHHGNVPAAVLALVDHYEHHAPVDIVTTECLQTLDISKVTTWDKSAGALYFKVPANPPLHIVFFRDEIIREITWAGNPEGHELWADSSATSGLKLHPRRSFAQYKETVAGQCQSWTASDLNAALEIRTVLIQLAQVKIHEFQQRQQNLMVAELNHRVKNILTLILAITRQTEVSSKSLTDYTQALESRISALSMAHDLVTGYSLEWPSLRKLLTIELQPYLHESTSKVILSGPTIGLKANFVPIFVLVIHELTSNAAKYGALSVSSGQLIIAWREQHGGIQFHWQESGGPPVTPPQRSGFGQELIELAIPYEFKGEATLHFLPAGVQADFWLPSNLLRWEAKSDTTAGNDASDKATSTASQETKDEINILVLEDSLLLAKEMEKMLKTIGLNRVKCVSNVADALKELQKFRYDGCLLDIDLKTETSFAVAYTLLLEEIPFVFTTGYNSKHPVPENLKSILLLKKPVNVSMLKASFWPMLKG